MYLEVIDSIKRIIFLLPQIILIVVSFQYLRKSKSLDAKLLLAGTILAIIINYVFKILYADLYADVDFEELDLSKFERLVLIQGILNSLTSILFIIGFYQVVNKYLKKTGKLQN